MDNETQKGDWEDAFESWEVGAFLPTLRENLKWYKDVGSDHGDLVIAEEAVTAAAKTLIKHLLAAQETAFKEREAKMREEAVSAAYRAVLDGDAALHYEMGRRAGLREANKSQGYGEGL